MSLMPQPYFPSPTGEKMSISSARRENERLDFVKGRFLTQGAHTNVVYF